MPAAALAYRCRLCGCLFDIGIVPDGNRAAALIAQGSPGPEEWGQPLPGVVDVHDCAPGRWGAADFLGARVPAAPDDEAHARTAWPATAAELLNLIDERLAQHRDNLRLWAEGYLDPTGPEATEREATVRELKAAVAELEALRKRLWPAFAAAGARSA
jgi:hypothetical protein